jgi:hypothetical protein
MPQGAGRDSPLWPNYARTFFNIGVTMPSKIRTEADRLATPKPTPAPGYTLAKAGIGQKRSLERGTATRSKKNPGKRAKKGG